MSLNEDSAERGGGTVTVTDTGTGCGTGSVQEGAPANTPTKRVSADSDDVAGDQKEVQVQVGLADYCVLVGELVRSCL